MNRILVIDDDAAIRMVIAEALKRDRHDVREAATLAEARGQLGQSMPDLLITDVMLPDGNGLDLLPVVLAKRADLPVIVLSAQNTLTTAIRATERGAFEYLPKPFDLDELRRAVREGLARRAPGPAAVPDEELPLIGRSPAMQDVYRVIARIAQTDLTVLLLGESGTGKELVARALHDFGSRRGKAFVVANMAAIPRESIEAELFGQERGGFAGAAGRTPGRFEQAAGGTLFLDEIGDMPLEAQTRLLRVLETGEYAGAGGRARRVDVRVIAATHQDLGRAIAEGRFREDLYYRLNVVPLALPPLRAREGDVALLAQHFLDRAGETGVRKTLDSAALRRLGEHDWPGNVRELENLMRRLAAMTRDRVIGLEDIDAQFAVRTADGQTASPSLEGRVEAWLQDHFRRAGEGLPVPGLYDRLLTEVDSAILRTTLSAVRGNQLRAAALLGINRNTLRKRLTGLGIDPKG